MWEEIGYNGWTIAATVFIVLFLVFALWGSVAQAREPWPWQQVAWPVCFMLAAICLMIGVPVPP